MSLSERLESARNRRAASPAYMQPDEAIGGERLDLPVLTPLEKLRDHDGRLETIAADIADLDGTPDAQSAAVEKVRSAATETLYERMGNRLTDPSLSEAQLTELARQELATIIGELGTGLTADQRTNLIEDVANDALGLGPLQRLLDDPTVTEVMVNGPDHIYVERNGRILRTGSSFRSEERLRRVIERIVSRVGRRIDESSPLVDARLPDGSRVNAIIPPLAVSGSALTIRKFATDPFQVRDLVELGTVSEALGELLLACVQARLNIVVSGGTGTGKTTLLNVLSSFIPADDRVVTIEDAVELQLQQEHVVRMETRPPNIEGKGEIRQRELVKNALRMRPDRVILGEVRSEEAFDMLQAMNTGHDGSLSTVHANSPRDAISRLETLSLMAGMDLPLRAVREQVASAIDLIIHVSRLRDGSRRVTHVTEVLGMEGDTVTLQDAFLFDYSQGLDDFGRFRGQIRPTGIRPRFTDRFVELGIPLDQNVFATDAQLSSLEEQRSW